MSFTVGHNLRGTSLTCGKLSIYNNILSTNTFTTEQITVNPPPNYQTTGTSINIFSQDATQKYPLGTLLEVGRNMYRYCQISTNLLLYTFEGGNLVGNRIYNAKQVMVITAIVGNTISFIVPTVPDSPTPLPAGANSYFLNELAGGRITSTATTGGQFDIISNNAAAATQTLTIVVAINPNITNPFTVGTTVIVTGSPWQIEPFSNYAGGPYQAPIGSILVDANYPFVGFVWIQTSGVARLKGSAWNGAPNPTRLPNVGLSIVPSRIGGTVTDIAGRIICPEDLPTSLYPQIGIGIVTSNIYDIYTPVFMQLL